MENKGESKATAASGADAAAPVPVPLDPKAGDVLSSKVHGHQLTWTTELQSCECDLCSKRVAASWRCVPWFD